MSVTKLRFKGTITRPGAERDTLLGGDPFQLELRDANDPATILYAVSIPAGQFISRRHRTVYDSTGTFPGSVILRNSRKQSGTVL